MSQIQVRDPAGNGIPRINIRISHKHEGTDQAIFDVFTDLMGNTGWPIPFWPAGDYTLWVNDHNIDAAWGQADLFVTNTADQQIVLQPTGVVPTPPTSSLSRFVRIDRPTHTFVNDQGQNVKCRGASAFLLYKRFLDGENIDPQLQQLHDLGRNLLRVMGMFESLGGFNPKAYGDRYYSSIPAFMERCRLFGHYVLWTACAATQGMFTEDEAIDHIKKTVEQLKVTVNVIFSPVNEQDQHNNGINISKYLSQVDMGWILHDNGSYGIDEPCPAPLGHFACLHTRRNFWAAIKDCATVDHPNYPQVEVAIDEGIRYGDEGSGDEHDSPARCADAAGTAYTALFWVFHSMQGEKAEVLHGNTLDCLTAVHAQGV